MIFTSAQILRRAVQERVERVDDAAVNAVLDRHQAVVDVAANDFIEHRRGCPPAARASTLLPNFCTQAACENVPVGPRKPIRSGFSSANEPLINSR